MSEAERPVRQVFDKYEVITADNAEQLGRSVMAMLLQNIGWQLYGPTMAVSKGTGVEYYQALLMYKYVQDPLPAEAAPEPEVI